MTGTAFSTVDKAEFYDFVAAHDDRRYEYVEGHIVQQMTGGSRAHGRIAGRFMRLIEDQLEATIWVVTQERGVETKATIRYPDVVVEPSSEPDDSHSTHRPALIVEVQSPSSVTRDLKRKPVEYQSLASLKAYIVASQTAMACLLWLRNDTGAFPDEPTQLVGADAVISVPQLNLNIPLAEIYRGIDLPPKDT